MAKIKKYVIKIDEDQFLGKLAHTQNSKAIIEKDDFKTHDSAMKWLDEELEKIKPSYENMSFNKLSTLLDKFPDNRKIRETLKDKICMLKEQMIFTLIFKEGVSEKKAIEQVKKAAGKNWTESLIKAKDNTLDALVSLEKEKTENRLNSLMKHAHESNWEASERAKIILDIIRQIPGQKIITANTEMETNVFDIDSNGVVGYETNHENILLAKFDVSLKPEETSSFIIRQMIPNSEEEVILENGKKIMMPWKAIYGFLLTKDHIIAMSAEDVEHACTHDMHNNKIEEEKLVIYKDFSEFIKIN